MDSDLGELEDWELLHPSDSSSVQELKHLDGSNNDDAQVLIRSDHFSLDSGGKTFNDGLIDELICNHQELGFIQNVEIEVGLDEVEENVVNDLGFVGSKKIDVGLVGDLDEGEDSRNFLSDSNGTEGNNEMSDQAKGLISGGGGEGDEYDDNTDILSREIKSGGGEEEKRNMILWKLPFEFLKYCVLRTGSVWSVSMAAGVIGFVIFGWRYYSVKRKSRNIQVKATMDEKKISQYKSRVVRLNEAFSIVKHVSITRPSFPDAAVTQW